MNMYRILILSILLGLTAAMNNCTSDSDCDHGYCVAVGTTAYCSCSSGFGGSGCAARPDSSCDSSYSPVSSDTGSFSTTGSITFNYPNLQVIFTANLQTSQYEFPSANDSLNQAPYETQTIITFGNGSNVLCDFPNGDIAWIQSAASAGSCEDTYSATMTWSDAKNKCGFEDLSGDKTYTQTVYITRTYVLPDLRTGESVTRTETSAHVLSVVFPTEVEVETQQVQVTGPSDVIAAITGISFDPSTDKWTLNVDTSVQGPFKLVNPVPSTYNGTIDSLHRLESGSTVIINVTPCNNDSQDCLQETTIHFIQGNAAVSCAGLSGVFQIVYGVACEESDASKCPLVGGETNTITIIVQTSDSCPTNDTITFTQTTLSTFSDAGCTTPRTSFITNQVAYFGAIITSSKGDIASRTVHSGSVCFQIGNGACTPVDYTVVTSANGNDPVFSVDFMGTANNRAVFSVLNQTPVEAQDFNIQATIDVSFTGAKRSINFERQTSNIRNVGMTATMTVTGHEDPEIVAAQSGASSLSWFGIHF